MNRVEAFNALFGKSSDLACQEAVDVLLGDLDVRDNEQDELADVFDEIDSFQAGMNDYIDQLEPDDLRIPFLKQFLPRKEVPEEKVPEEKVPEDEDPEDEDPAKDPVVVDDLDALLGGVGKREEIPEKKPKKVVGETKADVPAGAKLDPEIAEVTRLQAELLTATTRLEALSRVTVINTNLTWQIHDLLKTLRFQEDRIKIEQAHSKTLSPNLDEQAQGRRELASWHAYMNSYAQGNSGPDKILHGKHMLECIQLLYEGTNPTNDSGYLTRFVDGIIHP